jgi:hypothetical protein
MTAQLRTGRLVSLAQTLPDQGKDLFTRIANRVAQLERTLLLRSLQFNVIGEVSQCTFHTCAVPIHSNLSRPKQIRFTLLAVVNLRTSPR